MSARCASDELNTLNKLNLISSNTEWKASQEPLLWKNGQKQSGKLCDLSFLGPDVDTSSNGDKQMKGRTTSDEKEEMKKK